MSPEPGEISEATSDVSEDGRAAKLVEHVSLDIVSRLFALETFFFGVLANSLLRVGPASGLYSPQLG